MAQFFIRRPVFAIVLALLICLVGAVAISSLPVEQYPPLAPPNVQVQAIYPGAGAEVVEQSVATAIEQETNGVDGMLYMKSLNSSDGRMLLNVTFEVGTDLDVANTLTQNRVEQAQARLPEEVLAQGVTVKKLNPSILLVVTLSSPRGTHDALFLNNYAMLNVRNALQRVKGVAQVDLGSGGEYGMRVWLRPDELVRLQLTPSDVIAALREQNIQAPAGQVGAAPSPSDQQFTYTVRAPGKLATPEAFGNVILKAMPDGRQVRIRDVARVELGSEFYKSFARLNGTPAAPLIVYLLPDRSRQRDLHDDGIAGALVPRGRVVPDPVRHHARRRGLDRGHRAHAVRGRRAGRAGRVHVPAELARHLDPAAHGARLAARHVRRVQRARLLDQHADAVRHGAGDRHRGRRRDRRRRGGVASHRARAQPARRHRAGHARSVRAGGGRRARAHLGVRPGRVPRRAHGQAVSAVRAHHRRGGAAVGARGAHRCAGALCRAAQAAAPAGRHRAAFFFGGFEKLFAGLTNGYVRAAASLARRASLSLLLVGLAAAGSGGLNQVLPGGFVPEEDQGLLAVNLQLPNAAALTRTDDASRKVEQILGRTPGIQNYLAIGGLSVISNSFAPYSATFFAKLEPWDERERKGLSFGQIMGHLGRELSMLEEGIAFPFTIPPLPGFGTAGGVTFVLEDRSGSRSVAELGQNVRSFFQAASQRPEIARLFTAFDPGVPQVELEVDRDKARKLGIPITEVFNTLQTALGGAYVNDFNRFGRIYRVFVQAEAEERRTPEDITQLEVRSATTGAMIPLSTLVSLRPSTGAELTTRYNLYRAVEVVGAVAPGFSSGQAMAALEEVAEAVLPADMHLDYTGISLQQKTAPSPLPTFALALAIVFLLLAALYESWSLPVSVLLGTPFVALGAFLGVWLRDYDYNVFVQVGLIMLIGLAAKNAILIVEFAKLRREEGHDPVQAALMAARLRFRPIVMTALAFIIGVVPLMYASGSGSAARRVMGTTVFSGMLIATVLGVLAVPAFYVLVEKLRARWARGEPRTTTEPLPGAAE